MDRQQAAQHGPLTAILRRWSEGDRDAAGAVLAAVYDELRDVARRQLRRERRGHTLQATALVHETFLRLARAKNVRFDSRHHFVCVFACLMRRVLVDYARERHAAKRGMGANAVPLDDALCEAEGRAPDLVALDDALTRLGDRDPELAEIVELRFFGGLTLDETAEALRTSSATVSRGWRLARAWLHRELTGTDAAAT